MRICKCNGDHRGVRPLLRERIEQESEIELPGFIFLSHFLKSINSMGFLRFLVKIVHPRWTSHRSSTVLDEGWQWHRGRCAHCKKSLIYTQGTSSLAKLRDSLEYLFCDYFKALEGFGDESL